MADQKKLDRWADKLLDTGKRNNLINFRDTKSSIVEILYPDCESIFSKCAVGHVFEVFDPKIPDTETDQDSGNETGEAEVSQETGPDGKLSREAYRDYYAPGIKNKKSILYIFSFIRDRNYLCKYI